MADTTTSREPAGLLARIAASDLWWNLKRSPLALIAGVLLVLIIAAAVLAPLLALQNPYDLSQLDLMNAELPPA